MRPGSGVGREQCGFTLLEMTIVVAILGIAASIGVPHYALALRTARVGKARHDLITISRAIDLFRTNHGGALPPTLYVVGFGGKHDPWGSPYCFLNHADGTGDGLQWAIAGGLVDASALGPIEEHGDAGDGGDGSRPLGPTATPSRARGQQAQTVAAPEFASLSRDIRRPLSVAERAALASAVARNGNFSFFTALDAEAACRRDRQTFPLNTDYDLFSPGPDGSTSTLLGGCAVADDVIRAGNGGFFGPVSEY